MLFCHEAPEMFCGLQNITQLSITMRGSRRQRGNSNFGVNLSLNVSENVFIVVLHDIKFSTLTKSQLWRHWYRCHFVRP